jgi:aldehyde:ferredoxin oxidoreductase
MTGISPRTYPRPWYTHSTLGGWFGAELKYAGFDAIVIHGRASSPVVLEIEDGAARLVDAEGLWGRGARGTQLALRSRLGQRAQVLAIGPAGENRVRFATVQHAEENAAGHSGFGAVWGSKNLKAIVARGTGAVAVTDPGALLQEVLRAGKFSTTPTPVVLRDAGRRQGQETVRPICSQACTFDCRASNAYGRATDGRRLPGMCVGGMMLTNRGMDGTAYEDDGLLVPASVNFGLPQEQRFHSACNDLGLDLWFRLVMQPWLIRCRQLGVNEIRGYPIEPEDGGWFLRFTHDLAQREGLGDLFAEDLRRAVDELGGELPEAVIQLGRELEFDFGFPAHREGRFWDAEPLPFWVISAMMHVSESRDPTIGTHQSSLIHAEFMLANPELTRRRFRALSEKVWGFADALEPAVTGKAPVAIWSQHQHELIDALPMCDFAFPQLVRPFTGPDDWASAEEIAGDLDLDRRLLAAVTGEELTRQELDRVAERAFTLGRVMLARAGRARPTEEQQLVSHFTLPCRDDGTRVDAEGFSRIVDEYYAARGWDLELGWPQADQLQALGLGEAVPEIEEARRRFTSAGE